MSISLLMGCATSQGPRSRNEDAVGVDPLLGAAILADGMGGAAGGKEASEQTIDAAREFLRQHLAPALTADEITAQLKRLVDDVNQKVHQASMSTPGLCGMGSTLSLLLARDQTYFAVNVGDSRTYLLRDGELRQISRDHSLVQERIDAGLIRPEQAASQPDRNVLTRAIGTAPSVEPFLAQGEVAVGDTFILTSDGVHGVVVGEDLARTAAEADPSKVAQLLVDLANQQGTRDNASAAVVRIVSLAEASEQQPELDRVLTYVKGEGEAAPGRRPGKDALWLVAGAALVLLAIVLATLAPP